jgi:NAD(P)-dependent dehydrogenase (short-subunit alcohol dehydrogenase family)
MQNLEGRVAFITGGARGIGLGIARACAAAGVRVAIADRDEDSLSTADAELRELTDLRTYQLDVSDRTAYELVASDVTSRLGVVSLLLNNAGVVDSTSPSRMSDDLYTWMRSINIDGVHHGLELFLPGMVARRDGHIVNTASEAGVIASPSGFLYAMSKYAVMGVSETLRTEVGPMGIGVSVLIPGPVATNIVENAQRIRPNGAPDHSTRVSKILSESGEWLKKLGRSPDDVGELVLDAVLENRPYIFTRKELAEGLKARTEVMVAAMDHDQVFLDGLAGRHASGEVSMTTEGAQRG